jgi:cytochrome oxidase Cu insertion factor (SCO1/SenC/PrrC family)
MKNAISWTCVDVTVGAALCGRPRLIILLLLLIFCSNAISAQPQKRYSCTMHPAVTSKTAGSCPKCGMKLARTPVARVVAPTEGSLFSIPDVELLDQDGRKVHFYSDLVKGRVVAINFIFTTCTTVCPPMGATFARVQKELGSREAHFISISVDPVTDTPERLKAWRAKFNAGPGWTLITGEKQKIDELLRALSASTAKAADHSPAIVIGNDALGQWTRTYGLAKPSQIIQLIDKAKNGLLETHGKESQ